MAKAEAHRLPGGYVGVLDVLRRSSMDRRKVFIEGCHPRRSSRTWGSMPEIL